MDDRRTTKATIDGVSSADGIYIVRIRIHKPHPQRDDGSLQVFPFGFQRLVYPA
jgi:hypothetical protein